MVHLKPTARAKRLLKQLPALLQELEGQPATAAPREWRRQEIAESIAGRAQALGIVR